MPSTVNRYLHLNLTVAASFPMERLQILQITLFGRLAVLHMTKRIGEALHIKSEKLLTERLKAASSILVSPLLLS